MKNARTLITPDSLALIQSVTMQGSMAGAAREHGLVPSAVTYRVRQIEQALDVLLFDRSGKQARITPAGQELLREGERVLQELDAVARRIKRVATGWEPQLTIAVDSLISKRIMMELTEAFFQSGPNQAGPPTRLRVQTETLSGTLHSLLDGEADLAIGCLADAPSASGVQTEPLGEVPFVFAVAPHHPLAAAREPLSDAAIQSHRIVAVADSTRRKQSLTVGILPGQDVLTVSTLPDKLEAQIRGLGCGFVPAGIADRYVSTGRLVIKATERTPRTPKVCYAWQKAGRARPGQALAWWLKQLASATTCAALLNQH